MRMAKSTYYFEINKTDAVAAKNADLLTEIETIFEVNQHRYGVRRVHMELRNKGFIVNHKRVQRLMHGAGMLGKRPKEKYHSYKGEVGKVADNIVKRNFKADKPLQKWTTDVSQFNFAWGKCYLSPILDMATNEIISYDLALSPNMEQIKRMLDQAFKCFPNVEGLEFEIDSKTLERFQTEKALSTNGMTFIPCVYVDETNQCFPGIQINTLKFGSVKIPFQDAIAISKMFETFDPHLFAISMLRMCGKIE